MRQIDKDGVIATIAGNGNFGSGGDGLLAIDATLGGVSGLTVDDNDNLYVGTFFRVRKIQNPVVAGDVRSGAANLRLYPNPASSKLIVDLSVFGKENEVEIVIYDSYGKVTEKLSVQDDQAEFSIGSYSPGIYFLRASHEARNFVSKFVKK